MTATRLAEWKAPTGRILRPGATFKVEGRRGRWRFLCFVDGPCPHVEAVDAAKRSGNIRAFRPEAVHSVSMPAWATETDTARANTVDVP